MDDEQGGEQYEERDKAWIEIHRNNNFVPMLEYHINYPGAYVPQKFKRRLLKHLKGEGSSTSTK